MKLVRWALFVLCMMGLVLVVKIYIVDAMEIVYDKDLGAFGDYGLFRSKLPSSGTVSIVAGSKSFDGNATLHLTINGKERHELNKEVLLRLATHVNWLSHVGLDGIILADNAELRELKGGIVKIVCDSGENKGERYSMWICASGARSEIVKWKRDNTIVRAKTGPGITHQSIAVN